jgi:anthranilate synthase component 2
MILMIDNYDSFTYNLVQYVRDLGEQVVVRRNDTIPIDEIRDLAPDAIVISPGPGAPTSAGSCVEIVRELGAEIPILGVCLGHQCIAEAFGGVVRRARRVMHGKLSPVQHDGIGVFGGLKTPLRATRYHSLAVEAPQGLPACLEVSAWSLDENGARDEVMGLRHRELPIEGVQFHPEAILTECGHELLDNFLGLARDFQGRMARRECAAVEEAT